MILHKNHNSTIEAYFGIYKTFERLKRNYFYHRMEEDFKDYVWACDTDQWGKPSQQRQYI